MRRSAPVRFALLASAALLAVPLLGAAPARADDPSADPGATDPAAVDPQALAEEALAEVEEIVDAPADAAPTREDAPDLTMALRDLALLQEELSGEDRDAAEAYLSRPTDAVGTEPQDYMYFKGDEEDPICSDVVCVHYVLKTTDKNNGIAGTDTGDLAGSTAGDGIPDYAQFALGQVSKVDEQYVAAGYRAPMSDKGKGAHPSMTEAQSDLPDVYLGQIGNQGLYGYCTTDDPRAGANWGRHRGVYGYCVLDNDYRTSEFPTNTPRENLQVTAAHEYFHNVQFGYDIAEDSWFMEATATWAEDEVFDNVDDNINYLPYGPLTNPQTPLDSFSGLYQYGAWIWFRYLTEKFSAEQGGMPTLVRDIWRQADAEHGPDRYSVQATKRVLTSRGTSFEKQFRDFVNVNRRPASYYSEARANRYPSAPLFGRAALSPKRPVATYTTRLNHQTSRSYRFVPGVRKGGWYLRLTLDLAPTGRGSDATYTLKRRGKAPVTRRIVLKGNGDRVIGSTRIPFRTAVKVQWVEVTLINSSTRYKCDVGTGWRHTCRGKALDNRRPATLTGRIVNRGGGNDSGDGGSRVG